MSRWTRKSCWRIRFHISRACLYTRLQEMVSDSQKNDFQRCVVRRTRHEPVAYITGRQEFWSLEFQVNPRVLIPRPDTEVLVETALRLLTASRITARASSIWGPAAAALPLPSPLSCRTPISGRSTGRGQSCLLLKRMPTRHQVGHRITFACGDLLAPVSPGPPFFDLLVTNPPYIDPQVLDTLHSPKSAHGSRGRPGRRGGRSRFFTPACCTTVRLPAARRLLVAEIGERQKDAVVRLGQTQRPLRFQMCRPDYAGRDRVVVFQRTADVEP